MQSKCKEMPGRELLSGHLVLVLALTFLGCVAPGKNNFLTQTHFSPLVNRSAGLGEQ